MSEPASTKHSFEPGDRVTLSELGRRNAKKPERIGTVVALAATGSSYRVKWDDAERPALVHQSFLQRKE